ncbi:hypothetical protein I5535_18705 [Rhodobacteraceae bacterium F11138]|nr:hypothetical protein [Rhodobacteraceae bacterium F11138]
MIKVFMAGCDINRSPLSYRALAPLFQDAVERVATPGQADLYLFARGLGIRDAPRDLVMDWRARRRPVVLLSEEPFWDTTCMRRPLERDIVIDTEWGALPVVQLNHHTSAIFRFARIPYYLLTNNRFVNAYRWRFARNAAYGAGHWKQAFACRTVDLSFMFERRTGAHHDGRWPTGGIIGLCSWRTLLAETCTTGVVERLGQSWQGGISRFQLNNWHFDKLMRLDDRSRSMGAIENTHQPGYLTEKLFDAYACGARPLYVAGPGHRVHELGLPAAAWLNLYGLDPQEAAMRAAAPFVDDGFLDAFHAVQVQLAALFRDTGALLAERRRLRDALLAELQEVLETSASPPGRSAL